MKYTGILALVLLLIMVNALTVESIVRRNDKDYPFYDLVIDYKTFIKILNELKKLNDTTVDKYVDEITNALEKHDYYRVEKLLNELSEYLATKYRNTDDKELTRIITILNSIKKTSSEGVIIDYNKYVSILSKSRMHGETREEIIEDLLNYISRLGGEAGRELDINELMSSLEKLRGNREENIGSRSSNNVFKPPNMVSTGSKTGFVITTNQLYLPILAIIIAILLYMNRSYLANITGLLKKRVIKILIGLNESITKIKDPVVKVYLNWYYVTRYRGYYREKWETPREYLNRIRDKDLRSVGLEATELYEERIYGGREVDEDSILRIKELVRKLWRG